MEKLLRIVAPHFVAGAVFEKRGKQWHCVRAAPIIKWMVGAPIYKIKRHFKDKKLVIEWL